MAKKASKPKKTGGKQAAKAKAAAPKKAEPAKKAAPARPADKPKAAGGKRASWFDEKTHAPLIDQYARQLGSFIQTMADGRVDDSEIRQQEERLVKLMEEVEPRLDDALHGKVTRLLCELTAYDLMQMLKTWQDARPKTQFQG